MKELSIEEKAKRYDEALKVLHKYDGANIMFSQSLKEEMFPELKESEDEKIRKEIISAIHNYANKLEEKIPTEWLAWLEKQGNKKSDMRYSIIDELIKADDIYQMSMNDAMVEEAKSKAIASISKLSISELLGLEKQGAKVSAIEGFETEFERQVSGLIASAINKEHEYNQGYVKWTANSLLNYAKHELEKQGEQKPADKIEPKSTEWHREDEQNLNVCLGYIPDEFLRRWLTDIIHVKYDNVKVKCKDAKEYDSLYHQNKWRPSDEQMEALESATENCAYSEYQDCLRLLIKQLKKLRKK